LTRVSTTLHLVTGTKQAKQAAVEYDTSPSVDSPSAAPVDTVISPAQNSLQGTILCKGAEERRNHESSKCRGDEPLHLNACKLVRTNTHT
jgi:hypothetical protein